MAADGSHYRVRFAGNLGGGYVRVSAKMNGTA